MTKGNTTPPGANSPGKANVQKDLVCAGYALRAFQDSRNPYLTETFDLKAWTADEREFCFLFTPGNGTVSMPAQQRQLVERLLHKIAAVQGHKGWLFDGIPGDPGQIVG